MSKHYIEIDVNGNIVTGFSDAFQQPGPSSICINGDGGRQFSLILSDGSYSQDNPTILNGDTGIYLYQYIDNQVVAKTDTQIQAEINAKNS